MLDTDLTDVQKLKLLRRFSQLSRSAEAQIHGGARSAVIMALFDALELFQEGRLESVTPASWGDHWVGVEPKGIQTVCDMNVRTIRFSPTVRHYIKLFKPRCVGELYYIDIGGRANNEMLESLWLRFGIPVNADPIALGWKPVYWQDTSLMSELGTLILGEKQVCDGRKYHKQGIHYLGEALSRARNFSAGKQRYAQILGINELIRPPSRLWSTLVVPPDWPLPNWAYEELWRAELPRIAEDRRERLEIMREIRAERRKRQKKKE